jgi:hypothetical protein
MYQIGVALGGRDVLGPQLQMHMMQEQAGMRRTELEMRQQEIIRDQQNFMLQKQYQAGAMILQFTERISAIKNPEARAAAAKTAEGLIGPMLKGIGFNASPGLLKSLIDNPGTSTQLGSFLESRFGNDVNKINEVLGHLNEVDPKERPAQIKALIDLEVSGRVPKWLEHVGALSQDIRSNPTILQQIGALDEKGKAKPLDAQMLMRHVLQTEGITPADKAAITSIFSDKQYSPFLANRGIMTGESAEAGQKVGVESEAKLGTPQGAAELAQTQASTALSRAKTGEVPSQIALNQAQTLAAGTPVITPLNPNAGVAVTPKGPGNQPSIVIPPTPSAQAAGGMRDDFTKASKDFVTVRDFYAPMREAVKNPTPAGDTQLIFGFMKLLDPNSVVRESEYAAAAKSAGMPDRITTALENWVTGKKLTASQRQDFYKEAQSIMRKRTENQRSLESQYRGIAERNKVDPNDVVIDYVGGIEKEWGAKGANPPAKRVP